LLGQADCAWLRGETAPAVKRARLMKSARRGLGLVLVGLMSDLRGR